MFLRHDRVKMSLRNSYNGSFKVLEKVLKLLLLTAINVNVQYHPKGLSQYSWCRTTLLQAAFKSTSQKVRYYTIGTNCTFPSRINEHRMEKIGAGEVWLHIHISNVWLLHRCCPAAEQSSTTLLLLAILWRYNLAHWNTAVVRTCTRM